MVTYSVILHPVTMTLIEELIGVEFYTENVLHKSWFYLLQNELLTFDSL